MITTDNRPRTDQPRSREPAVPVTAPVWVSSHWQASLELAAGVVRHLLGDVEAWALWQKGIVRVRQVEGGAGEPGLLSCLRLGTHRLGIEVPYMLIASSDNIFVFAGGWKRDIRFVDVFAVEGDDCASTVTRNLQVRISGGLRLLRPLIAGYVRHAVKSAFALLD